MMLTISKAKQIMSMYFLEFSCSSNASITGCSSDSGKAQHCHLVCALRLPRQKKKKNQVFSQSYRREDLQKLVVFVCGFVAFTCDELNREIKREQ